ncbi:MAG: hypothetical protein K2H40_06880 [Lachnospiraceae bacterium]|nr:hypothetical protein [Lachnospiraceae bacterium]
MKKKYGLVLMLALAMGVTACASSPKEETASIENAAEPEVTETEESETEVPEEEAAEDARKDDTAPEEAAEGDPITGIVEKYADNVIVIKDEGDGITYYFSTQDAQVVEGDTPIAVGDKVQITYRGLLGDEEHPGVAVKIVAAEKGES